ncbi:class I SAM-dependent methyltransferase [Flavobacteriaceae bacterium]|nr:class I SAM-dependent methyltransferase [Flavobacteriaceae bacterium]
MILSQLKNIKRKLKIILINFEYKGLSTEQIFSKIYKDSSWDKKSLNFNSGPGSHNENLVLPYVKFVNSFIIDKKLKSIIDLGCGDFNVGKNIYRHVHKYYAFDIVPDLIKKNKIFFNDKKIIFDCKNFIDDKLPKADGVIIRQVLQHLDNKSITKILDKIKHYKYVIITEHIPKDIFTPNINKSIGLTTRLEFNSGINVEIEPFNFNFLTKKEIILDDKELGGVHKTVIYTLN